MRSHYLRAAVALACCFFAGIVSAQTSPSEGTTAGKTAEQVYKDIQVFKGLPADKIMSTMEFMDIALGVQCEHCHLPGTYDAPNANKNTARTMIKMQFDLIKGPFEAVPSISCYTCHRGAVTPPTLPPVEEKAAAVAQSEAGARVTTSPDRVLAKWVNASGGAAVLQKIATRIETGTITFGDTKSPIEVLTKLPDKRMSIAHAPDGESVTAFDGHNGWLGTVGRGSHAMTPDENEAALLDVAVALPSASNAAFSHMRMWRPEKIDGHDTNVLFSGTPEHPGVKLCFDKDSGLLLRMYRYLNTPIGQILTQIDYADYRDQDGVKMPFRWTVARPESRFTIQIDRVQLNLPIPDARFSQPNGPVPAQ